MKICKKCYQLTKQKLLLGGLLSVDEGITGCPIDLLMVDLNSSAGSLVISSCLGKFLTFDSRVHRLNANEFTFQVVKISSTTKNSRK